jgi:hypothetical protein
MKFLVAWTVLALMGAAAPALAQEPDARFSVD